MPGVVKLAQPAHLFVAQDIPGVLGLFDIALPAFAPRLNQGHQFLVALSEEFLRGVFPGRIVHLLHGVDDFPEYRPRVHAGIRLDADLLQRLIDALAPVGQLRVSLGDGIDLDVHEPAGIPPPLQRLLVNARLIAQGLQLVRPGSAVAHPVPGGFPNFLDGVHGPDKPVLQVVGRVHHALKGHRVRDLPRLVGGVGVIRGGVRRVPVGVLTVRQFAFSFLEIVVKICQLISGVIQLLFPLGDGVRVVAVFVFNLFQSRLQGTDNLLLLGDLFLQSPGLDLVLLLGAGVVPQFRTFRLQRTLQGL